MKNNNKQTTIFQDIEIAYHQFFRSWKVAVAVITTFILFLISMNLDKITIINEYLGGYAYLLYTFKDIIFIGIIFLLILALSNPIGADRISQKLNDVRY